MRTMCAWLCRCPDKLKHMLDYLAASAAKIGLHINTPKSAFLFIKDGDVHNVYFSIAEHLSAMSDWVSTGFLSKPVEYSVLLVQHQSGHQVDAETLSISNLAPWRKLDPLLTFPRALPCLPEKDADSKGYRSEGY